MSEQQITLYGYQNETKQVNDALQTKQRNLCFICLHGAGGMGKTTMLRAIYQQYASNKRFCIVPLLDFDDWGLHILHNVIDRIVQNVREHNPDASFGDYLTAAQRLHQLQDQGASRQLIEHQEELMVDAFLKDYELLSAKQRVVLLFDTVEKVQYAAFFEELIHLLLRLHNSVIIFSGREGVSLAEKLNKLDKTSKCVETVTLGGLKPEEARQYFLRSRLGDFIADEKPEQADLVCRLSAGRPILIDLAVDWLARGFSLPGEGKSSDQPDTNSLAKQQQDFERGLVEQVGDLSSPLNEIILEMAHIYHYFDIERLDHLHPDYTPEQKQSLLDDLSRFSFVKIQPGGGIRLHDEMNRMVENYVWPILDQTGERRRSLSRQMISYYQDKLEQSREVPIRWQALRAEQLFHQFYADFHQGMDAFEPDFRQALRTQQTGFAQVLLDTMNQFMDKFDDELKSWFNIHTGRLLRAQEKAERAIELIHPAKEKLQAIGVRHNLNMVCNALGFCYRQLGDWKQAIACFEEALSYSKQEHDASQIAETMNNIANVSRLGGDFDRANRYSLLSLQVRQRLISQRPDDLRSVGNSYYVRGMVSWETGNTAEAASYLAQAREFFAKAGYDDGIARVNNYEGYMHFRIGDPDEALRLALLAYKSFEEKGMSLEQAESLNLQARILVNKINIDTHADDDFKRAESLVGQALKIAERIHDHYRISECHLTLCRIYYTWARYHKRHKQDPEAARRMFTQADGEYNHPDGGQLARQRNYLALSSVYEWYMGDIEYERGEWSRAFNHYLQEMEMATHQKAARLFRSLNGLSFKLHNLPLGEDGSREPTRRYCDFIIENWKRRGLANDYPEVIEECEAIKTFLGLVNPDQLEYLHQWGENLLQRGEWELAIKTYQELLQANLTYKPGEKIAEAMNQTAWAYRQMGQFSLARRWCVQSMMLREKSAAPGPLATSHLVMGSIMWTTGNSVEAARELRLARQLFEKAGDPIGPARVDHQMAFLYFRINDYAKAQENILRSMNAFKDNDCYADLAASLNLYQRILLRTGRIEEARAANEECRRIAEQYGLSFTLAEAWLTAGMLELETATQAKTAEGNLEHQAQVRAIYQNGAAIARQHNYLLLSSVFESIAGQIAFKEGRYADAFEHYLQDLELGVQYALARMWRELDRIVALLVSLNEPLRSHCITFLTTEWQKRGLADKAPELPRLFQLLKEYNEYV